jgi:hypothetical protein
MPTRIPRASPAFAPPDMPPSADAAAETVAEAEARPATAELALGVGTLVATIRVDCSLAGVADARESSLSSDRCEDEGVAEGFLELESGLLVCFVSPPVVALDRGRSAGAMSVLGASRDCVTHTTSPV